MYRFTLCRICLWALIITLLFKCNTPAFSQNFDDYKPIKCEGAIPEVFRKRAVDKTEENKAKLVKAGEKRRIKKTKAEFVLKSTFAIDAMLNSGKVLFGDTLTRYVRAVAKNLLAHDPALYNKLQFFTVQSPHVNAFATDAGLIFVNIGLLAQVENEAQLAFILAHEIAHFVKNHSLSTYVKKEEILKDKGAYRDNAIADKIIAYHSFSKELETEADEYGLDIFLKSKYATEQVNGVFDVLLYSALPFDEVPFDRDFFKTDHCHLNPDYFTDTLKKIIAVEDYNDTLSTHPNIKSRRENIKKRIGGKKGGTQSFVLPETAFQYVQKIARFELSRMYLFFHEYENAIYNAYLSLKQNPSRFQEKIIARSLYGLAVHRNCHQYSDVHKDLSEAVGGERYALHYLMDKISIDDLNILALHYALDYQRRHPEDKEMEPIISELTYRLILQNYIKEADLSKTPPEPEKADSTDAKTVNKDKANTASGSKYDKIKNKLAEQSAPVAKTNEDFFKRYALVSFMENPLLKKSIKDANIILKKREAEAEVRKNKRLTRRERKELAKKELRIRSGQAGQYDNTELLARTGLGYMRYDKPVDKIVVISPEFLKIDERKKDQLDFVESESERAALVSRIKRCSQQAGLETVVLNPKDFEAKDVEDFNTMALMKRFIGERFLHKVDSLQPTEPVALAAAAARYQTSNFAFMMVNTTREKKTFQYNVVTFAYLISGYMAPVAVIRMFRPLNYSLFYTLVMDVKTGKAVYAATPFVRMKGAADVQNLYIYENLFTMRHPKKSKKK